MSVFTPRLITAEDGEKLLKQMGFPLDRVKYGAVSIRGGEDAMLEVTVVALINPEDIAEAWGKK